MGMTISPHTMADHDFCPKVQSVIRPAPTIKQITLSLIAVIYLLTTAAPQGIADENTDGHQVSFSKDIAPMLLRRCVSCHGEKKAESNYRLDTFALLQKAGDFDLNPVTPGDVDDSEILRLVSSTDPDERMPRGSDPLSEQQISLIRTWIEQGATYDGESPDQPLSAVIPRPKHPTPPETYPTSMPITALMFHQNELIASGHHELTIWNVESGELTNRIGGFGERILGMALSPDGTTLAVASGAPARQGEVRLIHPTDGAEVQWIGSFSGVSYDVAFSPDGSKLAIACEDRTIRIVEAATGTEIRTIENHSDWVTVVAWNPEGTLVVSGSRDKTAKVFEVETGKLRISYSGHGNPVFGVAFHPDGKQILSAGGDNKIHIWNLEDGKKTAEVAGYSGNVYQVLLADGNIYSTSADKTARQHQLDNREQKHVFGDHSDWVFALALDSNNQRLATGCYDGQIRIWNLADGSATLSFVAAPGTNSPPVKH